MAVGQQAGAAMILLPFAAAALPRETPPLPVGLSVLALALLCTALAYLLYFRLIADVGPTATSTVTFLVPAFGLLFGVLFLGEPLGAGTLAGLATILLGVVLTTGVRIGPPRKRDRQGRKLDDAPIPSASRQAMLRKVCEQAWGDRRGAIPTTRP